MTRLVAACVSASARSKSNDNTKHVELPVEGFWTRVRFPPPPPTKRPPLRWFFSWWIPVLSTRVHCGAVSHHAISGLVLRRRHTVERDDGGNTSTVVIVGEVGKAIITAHEYISYPDLRAGRADNCARVEMIHR